MCVEIDPHIYDMDMLRGMCVCVDIDTHIYAIDIYIGVCVSIYMYLST